MRLFMLSVISITLIALLGDSRAGEGKKKDSPTLPKELDWKRVVHLVETIVQVDGTQRLSVNNSEVLVRTPGIQKVVDMGPDALPLLIAAMRIDELSFDTFTRCYSACNQILDKLMPGTRVLWYGGCETKGAGALLKIHPGGQLDVVEFRKQVVDDAVKKCAQVLKRK